MMKTIAILVKSDGFRFQRTTMIQTDVMMMATQMMMAMDGLITKRCNAVQIL